MWRRVETWLVSTLDRVLPQHLPMTSHSHIVLYLWCAQPILQSVVAAILWRRKLHKQFPVFFVFLVAQVANFATLFPLSLAANAKMYFVLFWLSKPLTPVLVSQFMHSI